ncbi:hypothetical protein ACFYS8_18555 [Kitasatospora sp. NPDC004615]|uniref:hypothetical protein n=1 Tax=Kitasatospora sp. NPDC004615 TaxID=3364017 RepID=UPI0036BB896C
MRKNVFKRATAALLGAAVIALAAPAVTATATTPPATRSTDLLSGQKLATGQSMISGASELVMQSDGNLVLYLDSDTGHRGPVLWASGTYGNPGAYAYMQPDGNFVVYRQNGGPDTGGALWSTGSWGHPDATAHLLNGWLAVSGQQVYWQTHTGYSPAPGTANDTLDAQRPALPSGTWIESNSVWLIMQLDGNVVLYRKRDGAVLWASGTSGRPGTFLRLAGAPDAGALGIIDPSVGTIWSLPIANRPGDRAKVQDDGNFVLYGSDGTARWSTGTWGNW